MYRLILTGSVYLFGCDSGRVRSGTHELLYSLRSQALSRACLISRIARIFPTVTLSAFVPWAMQVMTTLNSTFGATFIGVLVSAVLVFISFDNILRCVAHFSTSLFGVTNLQLYVYFHTYPNDWMGHKLSVVWLWCVPQYIYEQQFT